MAAVGRRKDADVGLALRQLTVRALSAPTTTIAGSILAFSIVGWLIIQITGNDMGSIVRLVVGAYDVVMATTALLQALAKAQLALRALIGR